MGMEIWIDKVFKYGPYAVLILFALWVAPRQTKVLLNYKDKDRSSRYFCIAVAAGCWIVAAFMAWYIYQNWPPKTIYAGSLGTHITDVEIFTINQDFYISSQVIGDRVRWRYAIIVNPAELEPDTLFDFTLSLNDKETDYEIESKLLKERNNTLYLYADPNKPGILIYDHDNNPDTLKRPYEIAFYSQDKQLPKAGWMDAFAQDHNQRELIHALSSNNKYFRADARKKLRRLSNNELRSLLETDDFDLTSKARNQIEAELQRREEEGAHLDN